MLAEASAVVAEYISGLGLESAKNRLSGKVDEAHIKKALKDYILSQQKYNEIATLVEDIDFQGLTEYIEKHLLEDVSTSLFDPNSDIRMRKRKDIIAAAIAHAGAKNDEAKKRVESCLDACFQIVFSFFNAQLEIKDNILATKIVDELGKKDNETQKAIFDKIDQVQTKIISKIDCNGSMISIDEALHLSSDGKIQEIGASVQDMLKHLSIGHPLYPNYGYDYNDGIIRSKALSSEAQKLFPSRLLLTGKVRCGDQSFENFHENPFDYAYRHQLSLIMDVSQAVQYLGEIKDPIQENASRFVGRTIIANPPEFPPAFPCSIRIRNKSYFDYVLLRTQEIEDDGTYIISNAEQNEAICFEIRINPKNPSSSDYKVRIVNPNNHELLQYTQFMYDLSKEKDLHIYVLSAKSDLVAGTINDFELETGFNNIEEELDFLKRICFIEDYFNIQIIISDDISLHDYNAVCQLSDLIRGKEVVSTWEGLSFNKEVNQQLRSSIDSWTENDHAFMFAMDGYINLFGTQIKLRIMRTYKSVSIVDLDKLKEKLNVLEDGDSVRIIMHPKTDNSVIDTIAIPEEFRSI